MGDLLSRLAAFHGRSNVWRNLHTLIHKRKGLTLPISADVVSIHVRKRKPVRITQIYWQVLHIKNWLHFFLEHKPEILLGGCTLESGSWKRMFLRLLGLLQIDGSYAWSFCFRLQFRDGDTSQYTRWRRTGLSQKTLDGCSMAIDYITSGAPSLQW